MSLECNAYIFTVEVTNPYQYLGLQHLYLENPKYFLDFSVEFTAFSAKFDCL
jgi:hypothetical protein